MPALYLTQHGTVVRKDGGRLIIQYRKEKLGEVPLHTVEYVVVQAKVNFTSAVLYELLKRNIEVCFINRRGEMIGRLHGTEGKNSPLRIAQFKATLNEKTALSIAARFVAGKLGNMRYVLKRGLREGAPLNVDDIELIDEFISEVKKVKDFERLYGIEGYASTIYFKNLGRMLKRDSGFTFRERIRRPPTDPVNSLLSYLYTLLLADVTRVIQIIGFDPYIGFLHREHYGRPSLGCDLMEEFRPLLVDSLVVKLINKRMVTPSDFRHGENGAVELSDLVKKVVVDSYEEKKNSAQYYPYLDRKLPYHQIIDAQGRMLARHLLGEGDYIPFVKNK